ncbi:MAG: C69 family dipeptidase [Erysipelotrichaceae bacterium]|nr:C69 family dipeptidase [Erysipelotrichaceae bacterium]
MPCTTILAGKLATNDGSTLIARTDDGFYDEKKLIVVDPKKQPRKYKSVISHVEIDLPDNPMSYTASPLVETDKKGIWAATGINAANVGMTATETITTNPRVMAADPLVVYKKAENKKEKDTIGGIGEEDIVVLVLPYIHTAREGVLRLGSLLEQYGTYESNGIAFNDENEVWWLETIGGHHWIARRLPDDSYSVIANQFSLDMFDLEDALNGKKDYMASEDILTFIEQNDLDLNRAGHFNARDAFGSHTPTDHIYNTPRVWYGQRYFNPTSENWNKISPESDNLPWCREPEELITVADVKAVLSSNYEGTPYDPYENGPKAGIYRPIGINRTSFSQLIEIRNGVNELAAGVFWFGFASNAFNAFTPQYAQAQYFSDYFSTTPEEVSTQSFYWTSRLISAMADPEHKACMNLLDAYRLAVGSKSRWIMNQTEAKKDFTAKDLAQANQQISDLVQKETESMLGKVLYISSMKMTNRFSLSDN